MKKIKHLALCIIGATLVTASLFSCSNEDINSQNQENTESSTNLTAARSSSDPEDSSFEYELGQRYAAFELGERLIIVDEENNNFALKEATINDALKVYIYFDLQTNEVASIVDINKETLKMRIEDFTTNEILLYDDINSIEGFIDHGHNLLEIGQNYQTSGIPIFGGDRFWGWACSLEYTDSEGNCAIDCAYNILGTRTTPDHKLTRPCSAKPDHFRRRPEMTPENAFNP
ncbi:hypothetical protein MG290_11310 [Flavobacterium sp. CBA20B-1]|uniref:hypothetical protein n=1 Tax=unclassified Flavobacterium TaxID=196869 RepID=UPI0022242798|nr:MULTISPECIES: hypothetical protein [unclassified Flavobacterium]WCM41533.1 hypothetical protein MG290_11310 [Flavobacterium sp. CBA20B-1]